MCIENKQPLVGMLAVLAHSMLPFFPSALEEHSLMSVLQDLEQRKASVRQDVHLDASGHKVSGPPGR